MHYYLLNEIITDLEAFGWLSYKPKKVMFPTPEGFKGTWGGLAIFVYSVCSLTPSRETRFLVGLVLSSRHQQ